MSDCYTIRVDGARVLVCGAGPGVTAEDADALAEIVRAAWRRWADTKQVAAGDETRSEA